MRGTCLMITISLVAEIVSPCFPSPKQVQVQSKINLIETEQDAQCILDFLTTDSTSSHTRWTLFRYNRSDIGSATV